MNPKIQKHFGDAPVTWVAAWGISKLRKRGGRFAGAIPGEATWYDAWYDRVMSRETAEKLADLGVNLMILPFSLGGDARAERQEREDYERMTEFLHDVGIVSLPYLQYQDILQETWEPEDAEWAVGLDGSRTQYNYWRRTLCQSSTGFLDYFYDLIEDAVGRGADGVWIDNSYAKPCACASCVEGFRAYLRESRQDLLKELFLSDFDRVELPPSAAYLGATTDPIVQAYMEFNCRRNLNIHRKLKARLERLWPEALYASNPGLYRGQPYADRGLDFYAFTELHDLMYLENKLFTQAEGDTPVGNYHGFVACSRMGTPGIPGGWKSKVDFDSTTASAGHGMAESREEVERLVFEATAFNSVVGLFWTVRGRTYEDCENADELIEMYFERPDIHAAMKEALGYVRSLPSPAGRENLAEVAVYYSKPSLELDQPRAMSSLHCAERMLARERVPYDVLFTEELERLPAHALVVLPDVTLMSDAEAETFREYVRKGGRLLLIGGAGLHTERNRPRPDFALGDVAGITVYGEAPEVVRHDFGDGKTATVRIPGSTGRKIPDMFPSSTLVFPKWSERADVVAGELDALLRSGRQVEVECDGVVNVSLSKCGDGRAVLQLIRHDDAEEQEIVVRLREDVASADKGEWWAAYAPAVEVAAAREDSYRVFRLPRFGVYGALFV